MIMVQHPSRFPKVQRTVASEMRSNGADHLLRACCGYPWPLALVLMKEDRRPPPTNGNTLDYVEEVRARRCLRPATGSAFAKEEGDCAIYFSQYRGT